MDQAAEFREQATLWLRGMGPSSNSRVLMAHPAFQRIVGMGMDAVPLLLREINERPSLLVWALHRIIGRNHPVPDSARGNIKKMSLAWVKWGKQQGYL